MQTPLVLQTTHHGMIIEHSDGTVNITVGGPFKHATAALTEEQLDKTIQYLLELRHDLIIKGYPERYTLNTKD